ncbi:hypothetical protein E4191_16405 (plasmid) [Paracoccus liaowanqingii]|uniref:Uncharacterized protein n=1 Tax=Paracoccus liaowanqingii TaxID=2560053 RepID=A0A4Y5SSQ2_9RHOB|nr:hypothetical protein [Paracoccus liaowanqingii]QDA35744.1 hypothetical protein E4191_16405 [Paracoccus liaowanqingii]
MTSILKQGAIDFIDVTSVLGWFELRGNEALSASLVVGEMSSPVTLTPVENKPMRWRFRAQPEQPVSASDFASGAAALRIAQGGLFVNLPLWKPLAVAAAVQNLTPKELPFLLRTLPQKDRDALRTGLADLTRPSHASGPLRQRQERRALFGNAEFRVVAGSELVLLEIIETLITQGWSCDVTAWSIGEPMRTLAQAAGAQLITSPDQVNAFNYDLVWLNNRLEAVFDYNVTEASASRTLFVFAHLDRGWSFAQPGAVVEQILGGLFLVTASRGIDRIAEYGVPADKIRLFRNPAPQGFDMSPAENTERLTHLLVVSNHAPPEVRDATAMLREKGVRVDHWGSGGNVTGRRLTPEAMQSVDAVLTIGKTVPYALRAGRPTYVYDHFGGPGWLTDKNFAAAASRNFSGLCCERRMDAMSLCEELLSGFRDARGTAQRARQTWISDYLLEEVVARILVQQALAPTPEEHRQQLDNVRAAWLGERALALTAGTYFRGAMAAHRAQKI